jgi:hypothetical protein
MYAYFAKRVDRMFDVRLALATMRRKYKKQKLFEITKVKLALRPLNIGSR